MPRIYFSGVAALAVVFATPAFAQTHPVRVGGLTCNTGRRVGLVLGSRQDMACVFRSNVTREHYTYRGKIRRIGVDLGITRRNVGLGCLCAQFADWPGRR